MKSSGFKDVEIVVAETGWPYKGDSNEVGTNVENARGYNGNLIKHLRSKVGTPLMPGKSVDTYIFALYDENLKPGPASERSFGLFKPDLSATYDVSLAKSSQVSRYIVETVPIDCSTLQLLMVFRLVLHSLGIDYMKNFTIEPAQNCPAYFEYV